MKSSLPRLLQAVLVASVLTTGCSSARYHAYVDQAGSYFRRAERSVSGAVTRAADALGILPRAETMYARANVNVRTGPSTKYEAIGALTTGQTVPVVEEKSGWYWIRYGSGHGWVNSQYLIAGTPAAGTAVATNATASSPEPSRPRLVSGIPARSGGDATATETRIVAAEQPAAAPQTYEAGTTAESEPLIVHEIGGNDVLTPSEVDEMQQAAASHSDGALAPPTTTFNGEAPATLEDAAARAAQSEADQTDTVAEEDPGAAPGDASASAQAPADAPAQGSGSSSRLAEAAALGGDVDVAGITFQWGMSPHAAAERYGQRAQRVEANGAVWLQAKNVGSGVHLPVEWFDLRYCGNRLCGIHHVVNDVDGDKKIGDQIASTFSDQDGAPTSDFWTDFGYGRLRMRTWRTPSTRIRLSHQEAQTYVAIDYEPIGTSKPSLNGGTLARD